MKIERIQRDRRLTAEEAAHYQQIAEAAEREIPEIKSRYATQGYLGHLDEADLREVAGIARFLQAERERLGWSLAEVAERSGVKLDDLQAFEEGRYAEPPVSLLTRYARTVGKSLMLGLRQVEMLPQEALSEAGA